MNDQQRAGTVIDLWRYPVKSLLGERLASLELDDRGVVGDRIYAVRDTDGKFGSGKSTRRFRRMDGLFTLRATYRGGIPVVAFPDGSEYQGDDPVLATRLSDLVGRPVTLAREAEVSHLDAGPVHLITTASLRAIGRVLPSGALDARRFRPNLVIDAPGDAFLEDDWMGQEILVGETVRLRVTQGAERCVMIGFAQEELGAEPSLLRRVGEEHGTCLGVYVNVIVPGVITPNDPVRLG